MIAGLLNRRLPGPGSAIVGSHFRYTGACHAGDTLTATVRAKAKHAADHRIEFECRCVNQAGDVLAFVDPVVVLAATVWGITRGSDAVSGQLERGTMEMVLASPVRRTAVFVTQAAATTRRSG